MKHIAGEGETLLFHSGGNEIPLLSQIKALWRTEQQWTHLETDDPYFRMNEALLMTDFFTLDTANKVHEFFSQDISLFIERHLTFTQTKWRHKDGFTVPKFVSAGVQTLFNRLNELAGYDPWNTNIQGNPYISAWPALQGQGIIISGPGGTIRMDIRLSPCKVPVSNMYWLQKGETEGSMVDEICYSQPKTLEELYGPIAKDMMVRLLTHNYEESIKQHIPDCSQDASGEWAAKAKYIAQRTKNYRWDIVELMK